MRVTDSIAWVDLRRQEMVVRLRSVVAAVTKDPEDQRLADEALARWEQQAEGLVEWWTAREEDGDE